MEGKGWNPGIAPCQENEATARLGGEVMGSQELGLGKSSLRNLLHPSPPTCSWLCPELCPGWLGTSRGENLQTKLQREQTEQLKPGQEWERSSWKNKK